MRAHELFASIFGCKRWNDKLNFMLTQDELFGSCARLEFMKIENLCTFHYLAALHFQNMNVMLNKYFISTFCPLSLDIYCHSLVLDKFDMKRNSAEIDFARFSN